MLYHQNYDLYTLNTMRLHAVAADYYKPESIDELFSLIVRLKAEGTSYHLLGGGSNILMPPHVGTVVALGCICSDINFDGNCVEVGASVRIQQLIRKAQQHDLGGIEFLFTLPCQVGGAIAMNAGRGKSHGISISDFVESVTFLEVNSGQMLTFTKSECCFAYRHSVFKEHRLIIVKARLKLISRNFAEVELSIKERLERQRTHLDASRPSCGSVFSKYNRRLMRLLRGVHHGGAAYSKKTTNWISNMGNATYDDILFLVRLAKWFHKLTFQSFKLEIEIW